MQLFLYFWLSSNSTFLFCLTQKGGDPSLCVKLPHFKARWEWSVWSLGINWYWYCYYCCYRKHGVLKSVRLSSRTNANLNVYIFRRKVKEEKKIVGTTFPIGPYMFMIHDEAVPRLGLGQCPIWNQFFQKAKHGCKNTGVAFDGKICIYTLCTKTETQNEQVGTMCTQKRIAFFSENKSFLFFFWIDSLIITLFRKTERMLLQVLNQMFGNILVSRLSRNEKEEKVRVRHFRVVRHFFCTCIFF